MKPSMDASPRPERVTWSGRFVAAGDERAFRDARRTADDALVRLLGVFSIIAHLAFAFVDRALLAGRSELLLLLTVRAVIVVVCVGMLGAVQRMTVRAVDRALVFVMLLGAPLQYLVTLTRPVTFTGPLAGTVLMVVFTTIILPCRIRAVAPLTALACVAHAAARISQSVDPTLSISTVFILALTWTSALVMGASVKRSRRLEFLATREQHLLRQQLETALAEIRTLRGIVRICAFCKKIRDESGGWQRVEQYVRDRTHAEFSHGYCPSCVEEHYGDDALGD